MTYEEALVAIHGLEGRPWRNGLDRMRALVDAAALGSTLAGRRYIHIGGTNGKGTTTAFVESTLRAQGRSTGAFYSPYVIDYRERIQARGRLIAPDELVALVGRLLPIANAMTDTPFGGATKFEMEVAMGLAYWEEMGAEWVALEVGLGGRLDATNVVVPRACVIVSIGLDHTAILGHSLEEIAAEKAGIVKPGVPLVLGEMDERSAGVIAKVASRNGAPLWRMGREVRFWEQSGMLRVETPAGGFTGERPMLEGPSVLHNAALAVAACAAAGALGSHDLGRALIDAWLPGRFDWRYVGGHPVLFDGAHNAAAARTLAQGLGGRPLRLVSNMVSGHDTAGFYQAFLPNLVAVEVAPIDVPRALTVEDAVARLQSLGISARGHKSVEKALCAALAHKEQIVVTGSNYLVGEGLRSLSGNGSKVGEPTPTSDTHP